MVVIEYAGSSFTCRVTTRTYVGRTAEFYDLTLCARYVEANTTPSSHRKYGVNSVVLRVKMLRFIIS